MPSERPPPSPVERDLLRAARAAAAQAYAPYSRFRVGCALETVAGGRFVGCNVENASFGLTSCAERNAVFAAVQAEGPGVRLRRIAVVVRGTRRRFPPCGACRQVLAEFAVPTGPSATVVLWPGVRGLVRASLADLLPWVFGLSREAGPPS